MSSSNVITFPANPDAALPVAPTKRARGKAAKTPLAELNFKPIDVRKLLLSGQCDPSIKLPADIIKAIDQQALDMAQEAFDLCREHLVRRVSFSSVSGQPRTLNQRNALEAISRTDLGGALAHEYFRQLRVVAVMADSAARVSAELLEEIAETVGDY